MPKPVFGSLLFALALTAASSALATDAPPDAAEQQRMLAQIRQYASRYLESLPNFVCARVTAQYEAGEKPKKWSKRDTLTAKLVFKQGKEEDTLELVNGRPIPAGRYVARPLETEGEFGTLVSKVLDEQSAAQIAWSGWETLQGRRLAVFQYEIDQKHSTFQVGLSGVETILPYRGLVYADPETGELWRITSTPFDVPDFVETKSVTTTIDYGPVDIGNRHFLLPVTASILLDTGKRNFWNKVSFTEYQKFEAESKITFVTGSH